MVWEGREVVKTGRQLLGATNPLASAPGTIRGDFAIVSSYRANEFCCDTDHSTGRRSQRVPWLRWRGVSQKGDRSLVRERRDQQLDAG